MTKFNGISKAKRNDGTYLVRISDGDIEHDPVTEEQYRRLLCKPDFEDLPESDWLPQKFR